MQRISNKVLWVLVAALLPVLIMAGSVLFVRRNLFHLCQHWQEAFLYLFLLVGGFISGVVSLPEEYYQAFRKRLLLWGCAASFFLYCACSVLCQRIHFGDLKSAWCPVAGLVLVASGGFLHLWATAVRRRWFERSGSGLVTSGPYRRLRHPSYLGFLIAMTGLPLVFSSWLPLLALPGVFVVLRWRLEEAEKVLAEQFTHEFEQYKSQTWQVFPYLY